VAPNGSIGFRWGEKGKWNLEQRADGKDVELKLSLLDIRDSVVSVGFPTLAATKTRIFAA
jgi:nitrate reductase alpha subunit